MKKRLVYTLIISIIVVFLFADIANIFSSNNVNSSWYDSVRPSITPPNYIFPIAWTILYLMIAISFSLAYNRLKLKLKQKKMIIGSFLVNILFNSLWTVFYFGMKNLWLAFFDLLLIWLSILQLIILLWNIERKSSYLLIPYLLWVTFAGVLNFLSIGLLN
jgi:translocator protein